MIRPLHLLLLTLTLVATTTAHAHSVWIEPNDAGQLVVRFAEPGNDFETSPGHLDGLRMPVAFTIVTNGIAPVESPKKADHFLLANSSPTNAACVETTFTVRGKRKPLFYARWQPVGRTSANPLLTLDLVPTDKPGEVRAFFRGQPLGGIAAVLRAPDDTEQELTADAEGFIRFETGKPGQYLLTVAHHREPLAGFHAGRSYEQTSHNCSLVWKQPK